MEVSLPSTPRIVHHSGGGLAGWTSLASQCVSCNPSSQNSQLWNVCGVLGRYVEGKLRAASVLNNVGEVILIVVLQLVLCFNDFSDWYTTLYSICYEI